MKTLKHLATTLISLAGLTEAAAQPTITQQPANQSVSLGANVTFRVTATTTAPPLSYQWWFDNALVSDATNRTLVLTNVQLIHAGPYYVVVSDTTGGPTTSDTAVLDVDPTFTKITTGPVVSDGGNTTGNCWGDYDNDGFVDLFVANSGWNGALQKSFLYHNEHDGTFRRVTNGTLANLLLDANSAEFADYDNDGSLDLVLGVRGNSRRKLWHNNGDGTFNELTNAFPAISPSWMGATWADYNNDGLLDAFFSTYDVQNDLLYRNNGDGTFDRMSTNQVGDIVNERSSSVAPAWADYDNDGRPDVFVAVDLYGVSGSGRFRTNLLYHNLGGGTFERVTSGVVVEQGGNWGGGSWGDYDNDGWPDLFVGGDVGSPHNLLYHNLGNGAFEKVTSGPVVQDAVLTGCFTACWGDYDNDGFLDLYVARIGGGLLYHNNGDGTFSSVTRGSIAGDKGNCSTASWLDYDNDGFLDLFVGNGNVQSENNFLYHNNGNSNAWLVIKPIGTTSNRSGIGAKVRVTATYAGKARQQLREISSAESWRGINLYAHFGLGNATKADIVRIEWPSGTVQILTNVATGQILPVTEPRRPVLSSVVVTPTQVTGTITGDPNQTYEIDSADDLTTGWTLLNTVTTDAIGKTSWSDAGPAPQGRRFYKALSTP